MRIQRFLIAAAACCLMAVAGVSAEEVIELWLDDEDTYMCDDPFEESGCIVWLTTTTEDDCDGGEAVPSGRYFVELNEARAKVRRKITLIK